MEYDDIYRVLELYENTYRGWINDDGTHADLAKCAELISAEFD